MSGIIDLPATPGVEAAASCGCAFVHAKRRMIADGQWYMGDVIVVVPCKPGHIEIAMEVGALGEGQPLDGRGLLVGTLAAEMTARVSGEGR